MPTWKIDIAKSYYAGKDSHQYIQPKVLVWNLNLAYCLHPETFYFILFF